MNKLLASNQLSGFTSYIIQKKIVSIRDNTTEKKRKLLFIDNFIAKTHNFSISCTDRERAPSS